ncbi:hypothetical protein Phum_PHUM450420 [Pediculus humanus corporis]|uniref:F-box domain-containing protein n=1 Tax=Pediculus humanus subsp. corporis TaxID=121224 RepID=E0VUF6_PEDHC|nr:uncharacterized protein Phum_PHUM450420 [Pediculus humanus corporis]EEB17012.1 hypothetical protein Phum_PHUM450420 [Pediculus humanus corporis]
MNWGTTQYIKLTLKGVRIKMKYFFLNKMDYLPDEIILLIFDYSSGYDLTTSFQLVCTRWKYLINKSEKIWRGNVKLKGLKEQQCKNKLCEILITTPKLKYLQIGNSHNSTLTQTAACGETNNGNQEEGESSEEETEIILRTIRTYNQELEYLHVIDRYPLFDVMQTVLKRSKFKRLKITLDKLCDRREKINDLKKLFANLPSVDNMCIDFCQRIQFNCEKENFEWKISHDFDTDSIDDFN